MVNSVFSILLFRLAFLVTISSCQFYSSICGVLVETTVTVVVFEESALSNDLFCIYFVLFSWKWIKMDKHQAMKNE